MATQDQNVSIHPYFKVSEGNLSKFKDFCKKFVAATETEPACLYYGFSFNGDEVHCREGYIGAEGLLTHLGNVGSLLDAVLTFSTVRVEIHGTEQELAKLREPLAHLNATYFTLEYGFRK